MLLINRVEDPTQARVRTERLSWKSGCGWAEGGGFQVWHGAQDVWEALHSSAKLLWALASLLNQQSKSLQGSSHLCTSVTMSRSGDNGKRTGLGVTGPEFKFQLLSPNHFNFLASSSHIYSNNNNYLIRLL